jgi:carbon storage regulator CsrA
MSRLVLSRKLGETIVIHDKRGVLANIKITRIDRNQVRLTFTADEKVKVDRQEVFDKTLQLRK